MTQPTYANWDDAERWIDIRPDGGIEHQSILEKRWPDRLDVLLSCVEDNIYTHDGQRIDWPSVRADYQKALARVWIERAIEETTPQMFVG